MIKVSVMYPNKPGVRFDLTYYREKHMPLVQQRVGHQLKSYSIETGLAGGAPGQPAPYIAMGHMFFESLEAFQASFYPHANELTSDIPNYTDASPTLQISEVVVG